MARKVVVLTEITDDFDPTVEAEDTIEFTVDGWTYEIDCSTDRAQEFHAFLQPYIEVAHDKTKVKALSTARVLGEAAVGKKRMPRSPVGETTADRARIRKWAKANGFKTQKRGIISQKVRYAYAAATGHPVPPNENQFLEGPDAEEQRAERQRMRDWAKDNGYKVNERGGNLARHIQEAYQAALAEADDAETVEDEYDDTDDQPNSQGVTAAMREWARSNGYPIKRGYVSREYRDLYYEEQEAQTEQEAQA